MVAPNVTVTQNNQQVQTTLTAAGVPTGILQTGDQVFGSVLPTAQTAVLQNLVSGSALVLPRYRAALAATAANTADTRVAYAGDSTVAGAYGSGVIWTNCRTFCPPVLLGTYLSANLGLPVSQDAAFGQGNSTGQTDYDPRVTFANFTASGSNNGSPASLGGGCYRGDVNETSSFNFKFDSTFDTINVIYLLSSGGASFSIAVDGGSPIGAPVSTNNVSGAIATATRTCAPGLHTVNITRLSGTGAFPILGVYVTHSTVKRVLVWNWGSGGTTTANWNSVAQTYSLGNLGPSLSPTLLLIQLGINDAIGAVTNATALTNYQGLVDLYRATSDIVFITPTPVAAGSAALADQRGIVTACRAIAQQNGCPLIDSAAIYGTYLAGVSAGYFAPAVDVIHPGPTGYAAIASAVTRLPGLLR